MRSLLKSLCSIFSSSRVVLSLIAVLAMGMAPLGMAAMAEDSAGMRADVPKIDPNVERQESPRKPLQAGIQLNHSGQTAPRVLRSNANANGGGFSGKARSGAHSDGGNVLRGKTADQGNAFNLNTNAGFGIIGVKFILSSGKPPVINRVFAGTPAAQVGLSPEDAIIAVDGVPTIGLSKEEVYDLIIGSPGTRVTISIRRGGDFQAVSCTRMDINELTDPVVRRDYMMSM